MRALRLLVLPGLIALLAGCRCESEEPPQRRIEPPPAVEWYGVQVGTLRLRLPRSFQLSREHSMGNQVLFLDDEKGGHRATVLVYWNDWKGGIEQWAEHNRLKYDYPESPGKIHDQGWTNLDGRRAYFMVYELTSRVPKLGNKEMPFLLIDWYFVHDGKAGYLRGIALKNRFPFEFRPLFESIAGQARFEDA